MWKRSEEVINVSEGKGEVGGEGSEEVRKELPKAAPPSGDLVVLRQLCTLVGESEGEVIQRREARGGVGQFASLFKVDQRCYGGGALSEGFVSPRVGVGAEGERAEVTKRSEGEVDGGAPKRKVEVEGGEGGVKGRGHVLELLFVATILDYELDEGERKYVANWPEIRIVFSRN